MQVAAQLDLENCGSLPLATPEARHGFSSFQGQQKNAQAVAQLGPEFLGTLFASPSPAATLLIRTMWNLEVFRIDAANCPGSLRITHVLKNFLAVGFRPVQVGNMGIKKYRHMFGISTCFSYSLLAEWPLQSAACPKGCQADRPSLRRCHRLWVLVQANRHAYIWSLCYND